MMKKLVVLIISLIVLFILFIFIYFRKSDYELEYELDEYVITEKYDVEKQAYYFTIIYDNKTYELVSLDKYSTNRRLIENINLIEDNNTTCLEFESSTIDLYSICSADEEYYVANAYDTAEFNQTSEYENIKIGEIDDKTYLLWNYHDFIYLNESKQGTITLFSKDIYNLSLNYAFDNYLIIPDYEQDYIFDNIYVINTNNAKVTNIDLRFEVYFNSYFLGNYKNRVYLYDLKENQEFYIDLDKKEIYKTSNTILIDDEWESISNQTFQNERPTFSQNTSVNYTVEDSKIYLSIPDGQTKIAITSRTVSQLVYVDGLTVYYIANDILYKYNPLSKEEAILQYSEWNFNNQNMVFIFD